MKWITCLNCNNQTTADLVNCSCEECHEMDWSEPEDDGEDE